MKNYLKIIGLLIFGLWNLVSAQGFNEYPLGVYAESYDMVIDVNENIYLLWKTGFSTINVAKVVDNSLTETDSFTTSWIINSRFSRPRLAVKPDGSEIHTCFVSNGMDTVAHVWRDSSGSWHEETVWSYAGDGWYMAFPSFGVDAEGYVHLICQKWKDPLGSYVPYWRKTSSWSAPTNIQTPSGSEEYRDHSMNTDKDGGIHAAWKCLYTLGKYRYTPSGGNLADSPTIDIPNLTGNPGINDHVCYGETCKLDNGEVHHVYFHYTDRTFRHVIMPSGSASFNYPIYVASADNNESYYEELIPSVDGTSDGRLFCTWAETKSANYIKYVMLGEYSEGAWTISTVTDQANISLLGRAPMVITSTGLHIVWRGSGGQLILSTQTIVAPSISVQFPEGGEEFGIGDTIPISWTTESISGDVEILLRESDDSGGYVIDSAVAHDGSPYDYVIPGGVATGLYFIRIQQGSVVDDSGVFEIVPAGTADSITVTHPNGGETFEAGSSVTLTWDYTGDMANVRVEFSPDNGANWSTLYDSIPNTGSYTDTIPSDAPSSSNCLVRISDASDGWPSDTCDDVFTIIEPITTPLISLNRNTLNFGCNGTVYTQSQYFMVSNSGINTLNWTVSEGSNWLSCSPTSGTETGKVTCTVDISGLGVGTYTGTVTVSDPAAANSPQTVEITLNVYNFTTTDPPFGRFDSPVDGSDVYGALPVTGWALDDIEAEEILIKREPVASDPAGAIGTDGLVFIGNAVFVDGARPDVEAGYSSYPLCYRAGWGYMLLTNALPDGGNGTFVLHAVAYDKEGHRVDLGTKTINVNNEDSVMPFGAIDMPGQGGEASGSDFINSGWALTPLPNTIVDGTASVDVLIDSVVVGNGTYGDYRSDIESKYPGYNNSDGAGGHFTLDTTAYENGVHTISWHVRDDADHVSGIGSRFFTILNVDTTSSSGKSQNGAVFGNRDQIPEGIAEKELQGYVQDRGFIRITRGLKNGIGEKIYHSSDQEDFRLSIREGERLVIYLNTGKEKDPGQYLGYLQFGERLRSLPVGSTLDRKWGVFYWEPAPGFIGEYSLVFFDCGKHAFRNIKIVVEAKFQ